MNHGNTMARYSTIPGIQMVRRNKDHSLRSAANQKNDAERHEWRDRAFGERGRAAKKVEIEQPEFFVGFIPGIPAQHADAERRGQLHICGCAARETDDSGAGDGD